MKHYVDQKISNATLFFIFCMCFCVSIVCCVANGQQPSSVPWLPKTAIGTSTFVQYQSQVSADTKSRFNFDTAGKMCWGPGGSTTCDTTFSRSGVGALTMTGAGGIIAPLFTGPLTGNVTGNVTGTSASTTGIATPAKGGTGVATVPTNGFIPIGNGTNYVSALPISTNGVTFTGGSGTLTINTPQDLQTSASPTFNALTVSGPAAPSGTALATINGSGVIGNLQGIAGQYLAGAGAGGQSFATLNQAVVAGLTTASSPTFAGAALTSFSGSSSGNIAPAKNYLINGNMNIDQRNAGASVALANTVTGKWTVDRWGAATNFTTATVQRVATGIAGASVTTVGTGSEFAARLLGTTVGVGSGLFLGQNLPRESSSQLLGKNVIFSIKVKRNSTCSAGTFTLNITGSGTYENGIVSMHSGGVRGTATFNFTSISTTQFQTVSVTGGTSGQDYTNYVEVLVNGPSFVNGCALDITDADLSEGTQIPPFTLASGNGNPAGELALAQRYAYAPDIANSKFLGSFGTAVSTAAINSMISYPVTMRAVPTLTVSAAAHFSVNDGVTTTACSSLSLSSQVTASQGIFNCNTGSGLTQFRPYALVTNNASATMYFDSELPL